jgi:tRNA (adenine22-N1)-methyltransferase
LETTTQNWDDDIDDDECKKHKNNRAETIVNYALESGKDVVVADVGCGHGQMSLLLFSRGVKRVIGIDKSQNEVNYANECLRSFRRKSTSASESGDDDDDDDDDDQHQKTKNKIEFRIGDGLESVMEENVDVVIFAGMGTKLIRKLLSRGRSSETKSVRTLVINPPAGELVEFREWLWQNKWYIEKESLIIENANAHVVMKCTKKTGEEKTLSVLDLWLGKLQEEKKSSNVKAYAINRREYAKERMGVLEGLQSEGRLRDERELERYRNAYVALASWLEEEKT